MDFSFSDVRILIPSTSSVFVMYRSPNFLAYSLRGSYTLSLLSFAYQLERLLEGGGASHISHWLKP